MRRHHIAYVGAAFGSKFLFFVDPHGRALILDRVVRGWLAEHAGLRLRGGRDEREYVVWLRASAQWATALNVSAEQVELLIFTDGLDEGSAWRPAALPAEPPAAAARPATGKATTQAESRVILLGCVKSKLGHRAREKDLYVSPLWRGRRANAEASGHPWLILSAKHGLLDPEQMIAPYDVALAHLDADARRRWGERAIDALTERYGSLAGMTFEVHAGDAYSLAIAPGLAELGATLSRPLAGLTMGRQLGWYRTHNPAPVVGGIPPERRRRATPGETALSDPGPGPLAGARRGDRLAREPSRPRPARPVLVVGRRAGSEDDLNRPRTADRSRADLRRSDRRDKWPSGKAGSMTLAKRIGRNRLAGRIDGSTFRLTLASILGDQLKLVAIDARHLDRPSEQRLTDWMRTHLEVAVHPFATPDSLADLERQVLSELDPPLNLDGQPPSTVRTRVASLRRQRAHA